MSRDTVVQSRATEPPQRPYSATRKQLLILGLFPLSEAIAWTTIFPYIYSMVQSFSSSTSDDQNSAIYAGIMVSVFTFGEFVMAPQWAKISDRIGRKPTLLIGSVGAVFSALVFGFSTSLPWAIGARVCAGLLNPNLGVIQTFVGEMVRKEEQGIYILVQGLINDTCLIMTLMPLCHIVAKGFSVVPFLRSFGTIIGPVIGGYLAEPARKYPSLFVKNTIWDRYPYLLPNIVVVIFLLSSCIIGVFHLEEVHPKFRARVDVGKRLANATSNIFRGRAWDDDGAEYSVVETDEPSVELTQITSGGTEEIGDSTSQPPSAFSRQVILQILSSAILGFLKIATLAIIPIFLATPPEPIAPLAMAKNSRSSISNARGGFGLNTTSISNVLLSQAIATIIGQILAVPAIISRLGPLQSYRMILILLSFVFFSMPFAAGLPPWAGIPAILISLWAYALANGLATTCGAILITNTAPSPIHLAKINGAAASFGCLARTLGPAVSGPLFRLGLHRGCIGLPFWSLSAVTGLGVLISFFLRDHP